jgi:cation-transporting ATPase F
MENLKDKNWHQLPVEEVLQLLRVTSATGLSADEVQRRQKESGPNRVTPKRGIPA